ncbi:hypothetical protein D2E84_17010 [Mycobacteroides abscessus]|nr:hypothetical protein DDJ94_05290 [Mycobacteroides abscessus]RIT95002.1 hypothetical protein D2E84_17010 [Mycobacteroides abscessus]
MVVFLLGTGWGRAVALVPLLVDWLWRGLWGRILTSGLSGALSEIDLEGMGCLVDRFECLTDQLGVPC